MQEIALYGLGGQGVVTAARVLALAAGEYDGRFAQSIPAFTAERRGAPVHGYVRLSDEPILVRSFVYEPDCVVSFDWHATPWADLIAPGKKPFVSVTNLGSDRLGQFTELGLVGGYLDADLLTRQLLDSAPPNVAMLGAFAAVTDWITMNAISGAILEFWPGDQGERNALVAKAAYERTTIV